jgi:hypothetical protein
MTRQKSFTRRVRARMDKTSERYTAARRQLLAKTTEAGARRPYSDEVVRSNTGRTWDEWFALLDAWGAVERPHPEIARWLGQEHGVGGWWAQGVTVAYEQARGLRAPGQRRDGSWEVNVSKTVAVPVERLARPASPSASPPSATPRARSPSPTSASRPRDGRPAQGVLARAGRGAEAAAGGLTSAARSRAVAGTST